MRHLVLSAAPLMLVLIGCRPGGTSSGPTPFFSGHDAKAFFSRAAQEEGLRLARTGTSRSQQGRSGERVIDVLLAGDQAAGLDDADRDRIMAAYYDDVRHELGTAGFRPSRESRSGSVSRFRLGYGTGAFIWADATVDSKGQIRVVVLMHEHW